MTSVESESRRVATERLRTPQAQPAELLVVERLSREFRGRQVIGNFDLSLARGERVALCGPNGSGKTTILRCVLGTLRPTSGRISVDGHDAGSLKARKLIGAVLPQDRAFYLRLTGQVNLMFVAKVRGLGKREAARRVRE